MPLPVLVPVQWRAYQPVEQWRTGMLSCSRVRKRHFHYFQFVANDVHSWKRYVHRVRIGCSFGKQDNIRHRWRLWVLARSRSVIWPFFALFRKVEQGKWCNQASQHSYRAFLLDAAWRIAVTYGDLHDIKGLPFVFRHLQLESWYNIGLNNRTSLPVRGAKCNYKQVMWRHMNCIVLLQVCPSQQQGKKAFVINTCMWSRMLRLSQSKQDMCNVQP